ncbi:hypothetical protein HD554DRAFT_2038922 [Boletus coccyginus]|nr:hypothetical protein HD554DRAFT_2038922 [Boletus coccyginus]
MFGESNELSDEWEDIAECEGMMTGGEDNTNDEKDDRDDRNASDANGSDKDNIDDRVIANEGEELDDHIYTRSDFLLITHWTNIMSHSICIHGNDSFKMFSASSWYCVRLMIHILLYKAIDHFSQSSCHVHQVGLHKVLKPPPDISIVLILISLQFDNMIENGSPLIVPVYQTLAIISFSQKEKNLMTTDQDKTLVCWGHQWAMMLASVAGHQVDTLQADMLHSYPVQLLTLAGTPIKQDLQVILHVFLNLQIASRFGVIKEIGFGAPAAASLEGLEVISSTTRESIPARV